MKRKIVRQPQAQKPKLWKKKKIGGTGSNQQKDSFVDEAIESDESSEPDLDDDQEESDERQKRRVQQDEENDLAEAKESALQKRTRMAKSVLERIRVEEEKQDLEDAADQAMGEEEQKLAGVPIEERMNRKLQDDVLLQSGRLHRPIADSLISKISKALTADNDDEDDQGDADEKLRAASTIISTLVDLKRYGFDLVDFYPSVNPTNSSTSTATKPSPATMMMTMHPFAITCLCLSENGAYCFSGSKDGSIIKWNTVTGKAVHSIRGLRKSLKDMEHDLPETCHVGAVLAIAASTDGRFLATGGYDRLVRIWSQESLSYVTAFKGHRDSVTALSFRLETSILFSGSNDRSVRQWNVHEETYVESLFGHKSEVTSCDCLYRERIITGSTDRTLRFWKIPEETHLVFGPVNAGGGGELTRQAGADASKAKARVIISSIDVVKMVDEVHFVTGSAEDGSIALWNVSKRKPSSIIPSAHGVGNWITALACLRNSDLLASGSSDGRVKLWRVNFAKKMLQQTPIMVFSLPVLSGHITSLCFEPSGSFLLCAVSTEHRLGRWKTFASPVRNSIIKIVL